MDVTMAQHMLSATHTGLATPTSNGIYSSQVKACYLFYNTVALRLVHHKIVLIDDLAKLCGSDAAHKFPMVFHTDFQGYFLHPKKTW